MTNSEVIKKLEETIEQMRRIEDTVGSTIILALNQQFTRLKMDHSLKSKLDELKELIDSEINEHLRKELIRELLEFGENLMLDHLDINEYNFSDSY